MSRLFASVQCLATASYGAISAVEDSKVYLQYMLSWQLHLLYISIIFTE
jgi:hypothetical protein